MSNAKLEALSESITNFNEMVLNDKLSDQIVQNLWKDTAFQEVVEESGVEIGDICILLKADTSGKDIEDFRLAIEIAIDEGALDEEQEEVITDLSQELFVNFLDQYEEDKIKLLKAIKDYDPDWVDEEVGLHDALASSGGYVVENVD